MDASVERELDGDVDAVLVVVDERDRVDARRAAHRLLVVVRGGLRRPAVDAALERGSAGVEEAGAVNRDVDEFVAVDVHVADVLDVEARVGDDVAHLAQRVVDRTRLAVVELGRVGGDVLERLDVRRRHRLVHVVDPDGDDGGEVPLHAVGERDRLRLGAARRLVAVGEQDHQRLPPRGRRRVAELVLGEVDPARDAREHAGRGRLERLDRGVEHLQVRRDAAAVALAVELAPRAQVRVHVADLPREAVEGDEADARRRRVVRVEVEALDERPQEGDVLVPTSAIDDEASTTSM